MRTRHTIYGILINCAELALLYFGAFEHVEGAENVFVAWAWVHAFISIVAVAATIHISAVGKKLTEDQLQRYKIVAKKKFFDHLIFVVTLLQAAICAWVGWFVVCFLILWSVAAGAIMRQATKDYVEDAD